MKVPVLFVIFNRPETEQIVFDCIREYRPEKLYVAADGPREGKVGEYERCQEARDIIKAVDWPCVVKTLYREQNLGCGIGVSSAISWFFDNEEYGVIIEDDVIPSLDFFSLCEEALPRYQKEERVMMVSSFNPGARTLHSNQLGFTKYANIWAWATWRRAWANYDIEMSAASSKKLYDYINWYGLTLGIGYYHYCHQMLLSFEKTNRWHTWDYQWSLTLFFNNGFSLAPYVNLTRNVGVGDGCHYSDGGDDPYSKLKIGRLEYPLAFPDQITLDRWRYWLDITEFIRLRIIGLTKRIRRVLCMHKS